MAETRGDPRATLPEANLLAQHAGYRPNLTGHPAPAIADLASDPLLDVALRVYADFAQHATLAEILAVIAGCRTDLDTPSSEALPELVERLARQRLIDQVTNEIAPPEPRAVLNGQGRGRSGARVVRPEFSIQVAVTGPQCDLLVFGEVDLQNTDALVEAGLSAMADPGVKCLSVDLRAVTFLDCAGLGALVAIRDAAATQGKEFVLTNIPPRISRLLALTGQGGVFESRPKGSPSPRPEAPRLQAHISD
jgi:anti-anti-sigma factor